jgi:hypothetical protein
MMAVENGRASKKQPYPTAKSKMTRKGRIKPPPEEAEGARSGITDGNILFTWL